MKLAILSKTAQVVGGVETYLRELIPALREYGHTVLEWYEDGANASIDDIRTFSPDLLFVHGLKSAAVEKAALDIAPAVFFAHNYDSTCISGYKRWKRPSFVPCQRALGAGCLVHYFVSGCGGRNPLTMARDYERHSAHRAELLRYRAILTHSKWMQAEFQKNTEGRTPVHRIPFLVDVAPGAEGTPPESTWRVGFLGRHTALKGGDVLIAAAVQLERLGRPLEVWFMGEGPERDAWEKLAVGAETDRVRFRFWNHGDNTKPFLSQIHLLAVPSLWPEPFGRVGVEAAACGVPSVAFAVGGIPEWLQHLENGVQVPLSSDPAGSLANGIQTALEGGNYAGLAHNARQTPGRYTKEKHLAALLPLLENCLTQKESLPFRQND